MQTDVLLELAVEPVPADHEQVERTAKSIAASLGLTLYGEQETGQLVLGGWSEKTLNSALAILRYTVGDRVGAGAVQLAYRESVKVPAAADYTYKKQSDGVGEFARVIVHIAPGASSSGVQFRNDDVNGNVPSEYVDAVEKGAREAAQTGGLLGMPLTAIEIRLKDGAYHDIDSSPAAFEQAARGALVEAVRRAGVRLMEPLATVAVLAREQHVMPIVGELERRNASLAEVKMGATLAIVASGRMFDLIGFEAELDSIGAGEARAAFMLNGYAEVPSNELPPDITPAAAALRA